MDRRYILPPRRRRARAGGFTLIELLLALAVVVLVGALLLPAVNSLSRTINNQDPDRVFLDVVNAVRERALTTNRTVFLRVDAEQRVLTWSDEAGEETKTLPEGTKLNLLGVLEGTGHSILLGGVLVDTQVVPLVRFYPDGTCDRFRVQIMQGTSAPLVMAFDPWTCAPVLAPPKQP